MYRRVIYQKNKPVLPPSRLSAQLARALAHFQAQRSHATHNCFANKLLRAAAVKNCLGGENQRPDSLALPATHFARQCRRALPATQCARQRHWPVSLPIRVARFQPLFSRGWAIRPQGAKANSLQRWRVNQLLYH